MDLYKDSIAIEKFKKIESKLLNIIEAGLGDKEEVNELVDRFIYLFSTEEEQKKMEEYFHQINDMIEKIYEEKAIMLEQIDTSYLFSSALHLLCTERAKIYMNAIDRIEHNYLDNKIHSFIMRYKNL